MSDFIKRVYSINEANIENSLIVTNNNDNINNEEIKGDEL